MNVTGDCTLSTMAAPLVTYSNIVLQGQGSGATTITDNPSAWRPTLENNEAAQEAIDRSFTCSTSGENQTVITCPSAHFTLADQNESIQIVGGLGGIPTLLGTQDGTSDFESSIGSVISPTTAVLADPLPIHASNTTTNIRLRDHDMAIRGITFIFGGPDVTFTSGTGIYFAHVNNIALSDVRLCDVSCTNLPSDPFQGSKLIHFKDGSSVTIDRSVFHSWRELQDGVDVSGPFRTVLISNSDFQTGDNAVAAGPDGVNWPSYGYLGQGVVDTIVVANSTLAGGYNSVNIGGPDGAIRIPTNNVWFVNIVVPKVYISAGGMLLRSGTLSHITLSGWSGATQSADRYSGNVTFSGVVGGIPYNLNVSDIQIDHQSASTYPNIPIVAIEDGAIITNLHLDDPIPDLNGGKLIQSQPGSTIANLFTDDANLTDYALKGAVTNWSNSPAN